MTTFYTSFKHTGQLAANSLISKHDNSWSQQLADNAITDISTQADLHVNIPQDRFNIISREYTMTLNNSDQYSFASNGFWPELRAVLVENSADVPSVIKVKRGLNQVNNDFNTDRTIASPISPLAVLIEHLSSPPLGFPNDDEAANIDLDAVKADIDLNASSLTVGNFIQACEKSDSLISNPVSALDGSINLMGSLMAFLDSTGDAALTGVDSHLYRKNASLADDVAANPQSHFDTPFYFHANVGDTLVLNFVLGQSSASGSAPGCGRVLINVV